MGKIPLRKSPPRRSTAVLPVLALLLAAAASGAAAQVQHLPQVSPHAVAEQRIGLTDVRVDYHRPAVNGRTLWGGLVPYGQPWRAGANENTVLTVSTEVQLQGKTLPAGAYGLHVLPAEEGPWTVALSRNSTSWGSFSYDPAEDVLRVEVEPGAGPMTEQLLYRFDDVTRDSAVLALQWGELRLPIEVSADTTALTLESLRRELRGPAGFTWLGWSQAAAFCAADEACRADPARVEEALGWIGNSIQAEERMANRMTQAVLLDAKGDAAAAEEARKQGLAVGQPFEVHGYGRQLIAQGKPEEAMEIFRANAESHPDAWFVEVGLARGYSALGDSAKAAEHMRKALPGAPDNQRAAVEGLLAQLEKGEAIN